MPQIETWSRLPEAIRRHLIERMHDRKISLDDLNRLRIWMETKPEVPEGNWYKDFGSFKLCGEGKYPKTFLLSGASCNRDPDLNFLAATRAICVHLSITQVPNLPIYQISHNPCHPERHRAPGREVKSKDPDAPSFAMQHQGVLS